MNYLGIDCPGCGRRRLLVLSRGDVECEKCERRWDEPQAVAEAYNQDCESCEKAARRVQEACAGIAESQRVDPDDNFQYVADKIRALDIKKLLAEEGE